MAEAASCSKRSIITISSNLRMFGDVRAPLILGGRPRMITPFVLEALCEFLLEKPDLYLDEMADFLHDEFELLVSTYTISRAIRSQELCLNAGVKLLYLPPYSPDLNQIEEFFAELKAFVRRNWQHYTGQDFKEFLEWSLDIVGAKRESAEGHFRRANVVVEEETD
ncbi:hypothetical protein PENSUB_12761 [Penicillium subrubescens]|uniref:Tc1-like transposase DDE domain-containing protein n=1 Tax=Penicillium subrubescens TaxID=1316194 RepID=A0A1Q5SY02_9EURO|nr:hypothetical protein PENSUB_12761 [Penicillium subrubescens]